MSPVSDDEYGAYDFSEFTEDDFKRVDIDIACLIQGGPRVTIELPVETIPISPTSSTSNINTEGKQKAVATDNQSPLERHRRHGVLSVTDLTSLAWCEFQFDYGLRQRRSMPLAWRPASFVSGQGKEIFVAKEVAVQNDVRTKQGRALHKVLEREVKADELPVVTSSEEEIWALRLLNGLISFQGILLEGLTRELPVFGILHGQVVTGIIDEVVIKEVPTTPKRANGASFSPNNRSPKKARTLLSPAQHLVTEYLPPATATSSMPMESNTLVVACIESSIPQADEPSINAHASQRLLHLIDTKTRRSNSLPKDRDTLPSRLQLMLYCRLLRELSSLSSPFDFASMWRHVGVNPSARFSDEFILQAQLAEQSERSMTCLNDLVNAYFEAVLALNVADIDPNLELVYRLRSSVESAKGKSTRATRKKRTTVPEITQEERDLAKAIEASLRDQQTSKQSVQGGVAENIAQPLPATSVPTDTASPIPTVANVLQQIAMSGAGAEGESSKAKEPPSHTSTDSEVDKDDLTPIGRKEFLYNEKFLDDHIVHTLKWWRGERKPQGVALDDSWRCRTCEYEKGCEWREQKALEGI